MASGISNSLIRQVHKDINKKNEQPKEQFSFTGKIAQVYAKLKAVAAPQVPSKDHRIVYLRK
jgi:hypothetical protein